MASEKLPVVQRATPPATVMPRRGTLEWLDAHQHGEEDYARARSWLSVFADRSPNTLRAYEREVLRWRMFLQFRRGYASPTIMATATEEDATMYLRALGWRPSDKHYPDELFEPVLLPTELLAQFDQTHQPFQAAKSARSIKLATAILAAMYTFMGRTHDPNEAPYVRHNPFGRLVRMQDRSISKTDRYFSPDVYQAMRATASELAEVQDDSEQRRRARRAVWAMSLLFNTWVRISEACSITMASFVKHGPTWVVKVVGKGRKEREIVVGSTTMADLRTYRVQNGFTADPAGEVSPALLHVRRHHARTGSHVDADTIYRDIKWIAELTAQRLQTTASSTETPNSNEQLIARIRSISPHWFRHSGGSEALNSGLIALHDASLRLGHVSTQITTQMYYHGDHTRQADLLDQIAARRAQLDSSPKE